MSTPVADVRLKDLGELQRITDGGQGVVHRVTRRSGQLLKQYHAGIRVEANELRRLIARPAAMDAADRRLLEESAAWPIVRVMDGGRCVGFLMREAPARFATTIGRTTRLLELQYLLYPKKPMWQHLVLPSLDERRELTRQYIRYFQVLHRYDLVVGDVSMRNFLWTLDGGPGIFALDCDGYRVTGHHPAVPQAQTPDWEDPTVEPGRATLESDRYKLTLLVARVMLAEPRVTPQQVAQQTGLQDRLGPALAPLVVRAGDPGRPRPHPDQWLRAIDGRPTVSLSRPAASRAAKPGSPAPPQRPTVTLRPAEQSEQRPTPEPGSRPAISRRRRDEPTIAEG